MNSWTPNEVRKLISQIAGIALAIYSIILIINDVKAAGKVNITTSLISGEIESGSAGILLLFFSLFLIIIPTVALSKDKSNVKEKDLPKTSTKLSFKVRFIIGVLIGIIVSISLNYFGKLLVLHELYIGNLLIIGCFIVGSITGLGLIILVITFVSGELDSMDPDNANDDEKKQ